MFHNGSDHQGNPENHTIIRGLLYLFSLAFISFAATSVLGLKWFAGAAQQNASSASLVAMCLVGGIILYVIAVFMRTGLIKYRYNARPLNRVERIAIVFALLGFILLCGSGAFAAYASLDPNVTISSPVGFLGALFGGGLLFAAGVAASRSPDRIR
jgi:hypothetical protein